ncbi:peptidylprolyl isomerase [Luteolibacter marinus]|uniref:peptidylprolyl isomerase n=1 Tax=Luteolibacter marinus TaxID=2776705 RepID=UPI0031B9D582
MPRFPALLLALAAPLGAQIHADFTVSHGEDPPKVFRVLLAHEKAPRTCANFIGLATGRRPWIDVTRGRIVENTPFYDGLTFHRLIHDFVAQAGSPNGQGTDGPGYVIQDEYHPDLRHTGRYVLSMAKSGLPNTGGSQFFITLAATPHLDDKHSVFGEVISGKDVIDGFADPMAYPTDRSAAGAAPGAPGYFDRPVTPIVIESVTLSGPDLEGFEPDDPALELPRISAPRVTPSRNSSAKTFTLTFDRASQCAYLTRYSFDLRNWYSLQNSISLDSEPATELTITGVNFPRFFTRLVEVDYSPLTNAPASIAAAGTQLRITNRSGQWVELVFDGGSTGTWTSSDASSGTLGGVVWKDAAGSTGFNFLKSSVDIPLGYLSATFDAPAGVDGWLSFTDIPLSFHTPTSGWVEGNAKTSLQPAPYNLIPVNQAFEISP